MAVERVPSSLSPGGRRCGPAAPLAPRAGEAVAPACDLGAALEAALERHGARLVEALRAATPALQPWGSEPFQAEGRLILPGAAGAPAAVGTSAAAVAAAEGVSVAASAVDQAIASFTLPASGFVGIVESWLFRPHSLLGYDAGNLSFYLSLGGRRMRFPTQPQGVICGCEPQSVLAVAGPGNVVAVLATNANKNLWHLVEAALTGYLVEERLFRAVVNRL